MKICAVETIPLRIPFSAPFTIAAPYEQKRDCVDALIVRIHTDDGLCGIGETQAWRRQGSREVLANLVYVVKEIFTPILLGRCPSDIAMIMHDLNAVLHNSLYAQAAIGDALYDVVGKALNQPVYKLLGGRCRESIRVGLPLGATSSSPEMLDKAKRAFEQGYRHLRVKIGLTAEQDLENIRVLREYFGDRVVLRADANGGMSYQQALPLLKNLERYNLDIVEQPLPLWDLDGSAELSRRIAIPISADESLTTKESLVEIIKRRAASVIQTKIAKNGGIYYIRWLWAIAEAAGIAIFPGNHPSTSVATASVAHLCASWPGPLAVGDFQNGACYMLLTDIVKSPIRVDKGYIKVPEGPGLGMELDEDKVAQFRAA